MASITFKGFPDSLHRALKRRAKLHKRSLTSDVRSILEERIAAERPIDVEAMLADARKLRAQMDFVATPEEIDQFKREGRA
jgi:plasmid stability protein